MNKILYSSKDTIAFGREFAKSLNGGDILLLYGDLGTGKTTLVKGIAEGLKIFEDIASPSFTLMNVYGERRLAHVDTYRLIDEKQLIEIGIEDYLGDLDTITIIEWPEKISKLLEDKRVTSLYLSHTDSGRLISTTPPTS